MESERGSQVPSKHGGRERMSNEDGTRVRDSDAVRVSDGGVTIDQLYSELQSNRSDDDDTNVRLTPDQSSEAILDDVLTALFDEQNFNFADSTVKDNLDEILLLLVAHRDSDTHGKTLMSDLAVVFDTHLSPGTVYPQLHELSDDDLLEAQELVRTKEYQIKDEEAFAERIRGAMEQHLALGFYLQTALSEYLD